MDFKSEDDKRSVWAVTDFGAHGKTSNKYATIPSVGKINSKQIVDWLKLAIATVDTQSGLTLALTHLRPSKDDQDFQARIEKSLSEDGKSTKFTKKIFKKFVIAEKNWVLSDKTLTSVLLQASSDEPLIIKKILDNDGDVYSLIKSLVRDYGSDNAFNAMEIKKKLYEVKMDTEKSAKEFVESFELTHKSLVTAGDSLPDLDLAYLALTAIKADPRYEGSTKAYEAALITSKLKPSWEDVKKHAISLGAGDESKVEQSKIKVSAALLAKGKGKEILRWCSTCKIKHVKGKHHSEKKMSEIAAIAESIVQRVQDSAGRGRGNPRGGRFFRGGRGRFGGRFNGRSSGRFSNYDPSRPVVCYTCNETGHISRECPRNQQVGDKRPRETETAFNIQDEPEYMRELRRAVRQHISSHGTAFPALDPDQIEIALSLHGAEDVRKYIFIVDSGASRTLVYDKYWRLSNVERVEREIRTAGGGTILTICDGFLGTVPVTSMGEDLLIQLCGVSTLINLGYEISIKRDKMVISKLKEDDRELTYIYHIPKIDNMYILDIRKGIHEFGVCQKHSVRSRSLRNREIYAENQEIAIRESERFDDLPELVGDSDDDDDDEDVILGPTVPIRVDRYIDDVVMSQVGPFSVPIPRREASIERSTTTLVGRVHQLTEEGPFTSRANSASGGAQTPRFKVPKQAQRFLSSPSTPSREEIIRAEESFLRSPEAISQFGTTEAEEKSPSNESL
jgi:hypothetical protein